MIFIPIVLFWGLALFGFFSRKRHVLLYLFFASMPFGSFAVVPPAFTAGLTFTPTPILALLIIARTLLNPAGLKFALGAAIAPRGLLLLFLFWVVAIIVTLFMPRLFAGQVEIISMRGITFMQTDLLWPTTQNISQLTYLSISILAVFAFARLLNTPQMRQHALAAMVLGGTIAVVTGLLDFATQYVPISPLLEPFRTATYALLTDVEVMNAKRVVGLMPEASAFGSLSLTFLTLLYFFRRAMENDVLRNKAAPVLIGLLLIMAWLSTSSATYIGLAIFGILAAAEWLWQALSSGRHTRRRGVGVGLYLLLAGLSGLSFIIVFMPSALDPFIGLIDRMVFQKTSTSSFEERNFWTATSWQALLDTYGLGVGVGGTRASNAFVALASNTGFLGAFLYYAFVLQSLMRQARPGDIPGATMMSAIRWSFPPGFILSLLAGTSADFGSVGAFRYGLSLGIAGSLMLAASPRKATAGKSAQEVRHV